MYMSVIRTFKFRLYPTKDQKRELSIMLETHRRLYNTALDGKELCWDGAQANWSFYDQCKWYTIYRRINPWMKRINVRSAQKTLRKLDKAYQLFFKGGGFPQKKSEDQFHSFSYDFLQGGSGCKIVDSKLKIQYIGMIRVKWHRAIPGNATIKQCIVLREGNKWFANFSIVFDPTPLNTSGKVGIDLGIRAFVTTDQGITMGEANVLEKNLAELRRRRRALSRCRKDSHRREKVKKKYKDLHTKIRNTRRDIHHKVSRSLVNQFRYIAVESLEIEKMIKNHRLAWRIYDAAWRSFIEKLKYKAENAGSFIIMVSAVNTSQKCSQCGALVKKSLAVRTHKCKCGLKIDRDVNAARNILAGALPEIAKLDIGLV